MSVCLSLTALFPGPLPLFLSPHLSPSPSNVNPFTFIQVPLLHSSGAPRASLSHNRLFVWQCLCLEEGRLHEDSGRLADGGVRHRLQHNCQMVALL